MRCVGVIVPDRDLARGPADRFVSPVADSIAQELSNRAVSLPPHEARWAPSCARPFREHLCARIAHVGNARCSAANRAQRRFTDYQVACVDLCRAAARRFLKACAPLQ
jgi:hypothetical protein